MFYHIDASFLLLLVLRPASNRHIIGAGVPLRQLGAAFRR